MKTIIQSCLIQLVGFYMNMSLKRYWRWSPRNSPECHRRHRSFGDVSVDGTPYTWVRTCCTRLP